MATTNAQRLRAYKTRQEQRGLQRLDVWVAPAVMQLLLDRRVPTECYGRTLARLLLGRGRGRQS